MSTLDFFTTGDSWIDGAGLDGRDLVTGIAQIAASGDAVTTEIGTRVIGDSDHMEELNQVARLSAYQHQYHKANLDRDSGEFDTEPDERPVTDLCEANVIASTLLGTSGEPTGYHTVALDIDHPVRAIASSTPGNYHLYIDLPLVWEDYVKVIEVLAEVGLIQDGYAQASIARGHTDLRLPWIKKTTPVYNQAGELVAGVEDDPEGAA
ncbi:hypothetical protein [Kribbella sindirgiensis]|uniref:Uncharacterized protein n=1 Tax=Kribbella sindirgiensis TaxID=1124744 RepID=A0A4R0I042_9ACTN|nr:hypothetical protein [Kribbella sindirgiensis]TCC19928.1 hypothetical protein E0H50_37490 [Kribbella sindirgiensis]